MKICRENRNLVRIEKNIGHVNTQIHVVADDITRHAGSLFGWNGVG